MNQPLVHKSKWFWAWQDDREEEWLGEMARQGLHLVHAGPFGQYTFEKGTPRQVAYRLDFIQTSKKKEDYFQIFRDAGWEHVGEMANWQYWRKEVVDGKVPEIFTDNASKVQKYQRFLGVMAMLFPLYIIFLVNYNNVSRNLEEGFIHDLYEVAFFLFFVVVMTIIFTMMMVLRRINTLKK